MSTRRRALNLMAGAAALTGLHGLAFAATANEQRAGRRRLVLIFLRGGLHGLSAVPPPGPMARASR